MEEKNKKNKGLIVAIVILILLVLGLSGYIVYDKVLKEEPVKVEEPKETIEEPDFYDVSELVKNKYIKKIEESQNAEYIKIENGKVYIFNYEKFAIDEYESSKDLAFVEAKGIKGTPKTVVSKFVQSAYNNMFLVLTEEGDLYNLFVVDSVIGEFKKINNEKVLNLYDFYQGDITIIDYPFNAKTVYAELENGKLMEVNGKAQMVKTFEEVWPYPDKICNYNVTADGTCGGLVISPERILATEKYDQTNDGYVYEAIKFEDNEIKVKESFSVNGNNETNYYVISMDDELYEIKQDLTDYSNISVKKISDIKVKDFSFDIPNYNLEFEYGKAKITYINGSSKEFDKVITVSTLYERYNK